VHSCDCIGIYIVNQLLQRTIRAPAAVISKMLSNRILAFFLALVSLASQTTARTDGAFAGTVFIGGPWDYDPAFSGNGNSRCIEVVERASAFLIDELQFAITQYWWDNGPLNPPDNFDASCSGTYLEDYYCYNRFNSTTISHWCYVRMDGNCPEPTLEEINSFKLHVGACMKRAAELGFDITVNARIDDGRSLGGWRNTLNFDPLENYGQYSYKTAILNPISEIMLQAAGPNTKLSFTLQGEMGATVFLHPDQWLKVANQVRQELSDGRNNNNSSGSGSGSVPEVGLGINNLKLCGCIGVPVINANTYLDTVLPVEFPKVADQFNIPAIQTLFKQGLDYVSLSAYVPHYGSNVLTFPPCDMEALMERLDREFSYYNLTLKDLVRENGVGIHFQEFGVGGGRDPYGNPARSAKEAAEFPYFGIEPAQYKKANDPFTQIPEIREYRKHYFESTSDWIQQGGCEYYVERVYLWNLNSWDVLALYPTAMTEGEGSYLDEELVGVIERHNRDMGVVKGGGEQDVLVQQGG
jgi:hypothetical protein